MHLMARARHGLAWFGMAAAKHGPLGIGNAWLGFAAALQSLARQCDGLAWSEWHHNERQRLCGGQRRFAEAMDDGEPLWHRQALTRTAEARLGWPLTREGTVARRTAMASHHRATAQQSMAKEGLCSALAWSARRCEARPRLRSERSVGAWQSLAQLRLSEDGVATARKSDVIKRKGNGKASLRTDSLGSGNAKHGDGYAQLCYAQR